MEAYISHSTADIREKVAAAAQNSWNNAEHYLQLKRALSLDKNVA